MVYHIPTLKFLCLNTLGEYGIHCTYSELMCLNSWNKYGLPHTYGEVHVSEHQGPNWYIIYLP